MTDDDMDQIFALPSGLDETTLPDLLALAGPSDGPELMRRLIDDIGRVSAGLAAALAVDDHVALRWHSHVLLAIAGTVGAPRAYALAKRLNLRAKEEACVATDPASVELMTDLEKVILRLRQISVEMGMAR
ncbi:hypothetical protein GC209_02315 [bacterium]|nr:hypothetical protein [bacterium]